MKLPGLRDFTTARVSLGQAGDSLPLTEVLKLQLAHTRAREAVYSTLDRPTLASELAPVLCVRSQAADRSTYLRRPDLGRRLNEESRRLLVRAQGSFDASFVVADGLSATAINRHATPLLCAVHDLLAPQQWNLAPVVLVEQGRVAIGDDIGACLGASLVVVLIGERPGLSCHDSLGIYLTWHPRLGLTDADRNCISNVHANGLSYAAAAHTLTFLMHEARRRKLSGVSLKEEANRLEA